jgi:hypothetical protein
MGSWTGLFHYLFLYCTVGNDDYPKPFSTPNRLDIGEIRTSSILAVFDVSSGPPSTRMTKVVLHITIRVRDDQLPRLRCRSPWRVTDLDKQKKTDCFKIF